MLVGHINLIEIVILVELKLSFYQAYTSISKLQQHEVARGQASG
jgi:hypothetical protein